ncbi:PH domain-containing protein [Sinosporangium siamense]|uniref:Membrane protein n=1 Tax=Sinosporangium siamense TaxID=1367973 RepID=A0A919RCE0_9ACTN|nr:PH domain-containing protein [Sinosporangium siamense]GII90200.1 membrane protein [Sinosporangium siamense]
MNELRLRQPRHSADPRAVRYWTVDAVIGAVVVVVPLAVAYQLTGRPAALGAAAAGAAVLAVALTVFAPRVYYRAVRWEVTDEAVYTRSGLMVRTWRAAPLSRVQTVDTVRGPLQRHFGLADVTVTTASAAGALKIRGLDHEEAARLAEQLTLLTQATPGDAT